MKQIKINKPKNKPIPTQKVTIGKVPVEVNQKVNKDFIAI
jgi:hypothetical protein